MTGKHVAIIGGGPSGLMAAEVLAASGHDVCLYEAMPTVGRKFLMAGKSGLNLTHAEDYEAFVARFGAAVPWLRTALDAFPPRDVRNWADSLGSKTFVGTSGRVFPTEMKASPLLRSWLRRLEGQGVRILTRHRCVAVMDRQLVLGTPEGRKTARADAVLLALGGASWPRLGSDAAWVHWLREQGVAIADFKPANCGFEIGWSETFRERFAGAAIKSVTATSDAGSLQGEFVISGNGIEGSLVYAHSAALRDRLDRHSDAVLTLDLSPGRSRDRLVRDLSRQDGKASFSNRLRKGAGLEGVKLGLLREVMPDVARIGTAELAEAIKAVPLRVQRPRPIAEAISSAGGVEWEAVDEHYMLKALPGVFVAGEMLDWEAPTGGYLLTACLATGAAAGHGLDAWLASVSR